MIARRPEEVLLASGFSVAQYRAAVINADRAALAEFLENRFLERYVRPIYPRAGRNGFTMMAVCCLMIESLERFRIGPTQMRRKKDYEAFEGFFARHPPFHELVPFARDFYGHVRCGILHDAQTTGSWRIRRDSSPLFDPSTLTIHAEKFHAALSDALTSYSLDLRASAWNDTLWANFRETVDLMCRNAGVQAN